MRPQFNTMLRLRNTAASTLMLEVLDGLLLIFIFVELLGKGPEFSRAVVEIGVLGAVVLVLALAAFVLRARRGGGEAAST
jgi:hypothetical protein